MRDPDGGRFTYGYAALPKPNANQLATLKAVFCAFLDNVGNLRRRVSVLVAFVVGVHFQVVPAGATARLLKQGLLLLVGRRLVFEERLQSFVLLTGYQEVVPVRLWIDDLDGAVPLRRDCRTLFVADLRWHVCNSTPLTARREYGTPDLCEGRQELQTPTPAGVRCLSTSFATITP
jgi:hypothetical protein